MNRTIGSVLALTLCLSFTGCCGGWGCGRGRGGCSDRVYWGDWYAGAPRCNNNCSFDCDQIDWRGGCNTCGGCNDGCGSCPTASIGSIWSRWVSRYEQPSCECGRADCATCGPAMEGCDSCTRGGGGHHGHHHEMHDGIQGEVIYDGPAENAPRSNRQPTPAAPKVDTAPPAPPHNVRPGPANETGMRSMRSRDREYRSVSSMR